MKKVISLIMALTLVMGVNASFSPLMKKAVKNAPRLEQVQKQTVAQPATVKHAHKNFRHIDRAAMRKAPMAATTVTFEPADFAGQGTEGTGSAVSVTKSGVTISSDKGYGHSNYSTGLPDQFRVYSGGELTIEASATITKIEFTFEDNKDGFLETSYTPNSTSWSETLGAQARISLIVVSLDGEVPPTPPTPPTPSGDVEITGLNYADAVLYEDDTYGDYWEFDFYNDLEDGGDGYYYMTAPSVYFVCEESTTSGTNIAGTWTAYNAAYYATDDDEAGVYTDEDVPVGSLTVTCVSAGVYNFVGSFVGEDGKTYTWALNNMEVEAYNGETYEDITLTDGGDGPTPVGDTTALTTLDAFEFGYYGSYSEEGAYNYTLVLYNSQDDNYVPQVGLDIYTEVKDELTGNFTVKGGNLGLDYSAFYPTADSEGESFTDASVTIMEGEGDELTVEGIFTTEAGKTYTFSVTAEPYIYDAEHPYEPQEVKTFNLTAVEGELDETYFAEYGLVYYYLYMEDGSLVGLTYRTANGTEPKGTFAISDEESADAFLTGMDYYGYADGSYYETVEGDVYYFVSGSVTLATDELGNTTITANATSCYGSTFTVTGVIGGKQPSGDHTIVIADYADVNFTTMDGAYTVASAQNDGQNPPAYNGTSEDLRLYAKNTFTLTKNTKDGPMTKIIFNISDKGLARQAEITPSVGSMAYDMTNATVTWTGEASEITFTVGDLNVYGSDAKTKAGQFDFTSMDIEGSDYSALDNINTGVKAVKFFDGKQVIIERNGRQYNLLGTQF